MGADNLYSIRKFIETRHKEHINKFQIKLFDAIPSVGIYSLDDRAFFNLYPPGEKADNAPEMELSTSSQFGKHLEKHFKLMWKSKRNISPYEYMFMSINPSQIDSVDADKKLHYILEESEDAGNNELKRTYHFTTVGEADLSKELESKASNKEALKFSIGRREKESLIIFETDKSRKENIMEKIKIRYQINDENNSIIGKDPPIFSFILKIDRPEKIRYSSEIASGQ